MIAAAVKELPNSEITAVTILTSLSDQDLTDIGYQGNALDSAVNLASLAITAGAKAIVCSPMEVAAIPSSRSRLLLFRQEPTPPAPWPSGGARSLASREAPVRDSRA